MNRCIWTAKSTSTEKPWGHEITWSGLFHGKEIHLRAGHRTSLKFHPNKEEALYVQHGMITAEIADEKHFVDPILDPARAVKLQKGDVLNVQPGCAYRLTALKDSVVFEISSANAGTSVRLEDDYGREVVEDERYTFIHPKNDN
jgi:mannose-6-phosphate isomerase-like protein (cupin superfamily)